MKVTLKLPRISMNFEEGTFQEWTVPVGQSFKTGETLYVVETDKTSAEVEAPCDGVMVEHLVAVGDEVAAGANICKIQKTD